MQCHLSAPIPLPAIRCAKNGWLYSALITLTLCIFCKSQVLLKLKSFCELQGDKKLKIFIDLDFCNVTPLSPFIVLDFKLNLKCNVTLASNSISPLVWKERLVI